MKSATVLITGALTGIGRATALAFATEGYNVAISGRRTEAGQQLAKELRGKGVEAEFFQADVTDETQVASMIAGTLKRFGRLDVAVNNAGAEGELGPITDQTVTNYRTTFDTNVLGVLLSLKHELSAMQTQGSGSIINLSSIAGQVGMAGASVYVASKHAVEGLTKSAALEVAASGIRVNAVAPGPVETAMLERFTGGNADAKAGMIAMMPAKRGAQPEEIAQTILFLASDKARYLTGQSIAVDGGYTAQ
jgi:NAD(P)-dependent dehydrogenase (short-subunit alcohol dehydrogenase family)